MIKLPYRQPGHLGEPPGYLVPDDAADEDEVPGKIIWFYFGGDLETHVHQRVFCPYMSEQFHQRV